MDQYEKYLAEQRERLKRDVKGYWLDTGNEDKKDTLQRIYPHRKKVDVRPKDLRSL